MTEPSKPAYRQRPLEAEAVQWTGTNADQLRAFAGGNFDTVEPEDRIEDPDQDAQLLVEASHWVGIGPGDWVLKFQGYFVAKSDAAFRAVWEPAVSSSAPANRAELRDRIRRAVCEAEGFAWDSDLLEPDEYGEVADAVLAVLPAPADRTLLETAPSEPQPDTEFAYLFWECEEPDGCEHGEGEACPSVRVHRDDYDGLIDFLSDDRRIRADLGTAVKALAAANARIAELEAAVPSRFDATPLQVEEHLKRVLAEDVRLRHQQAIGGRAVTEAAKEVRAEAADELHPAIRGAYTRTADFIDPLKGGGPYPSALVEFPVRPAVDGVQR